MRVDIPNTTLCCIDCSTPELAVRALSISLAKCRFQEALLLTDRPMQAEGVTVRQIPSIKSAVEYSVFVLTELARHISTDFVLLIQWDGYVLSGAAWRPEFQAYDYVGARWTHVPGVDVGNGGFSLRSRRLLEATADPAFVVGHPEDEAICVVNRPLLALGHCLRFAPPALADRFAFERYRDDGPHFGFHGLFNFADILGDDELPGFLAMLPERTARTPEFLEVVLRYHSLGRLAAARTVWRRALELRPESEMNAFLLERILPAELGPRLIADLSGTR
jgi:hypothetical protein